MHGRGRSDLAEGQYYRRLHLSLQQLVEPRRELGHWHKPMQDPLVLANDSWQKTIAR
jgi:hypothetical protein